ncbi:hypothetical protein RI129_009432 [Pyrocoelia pectoralis]|uniref:Ionotropic glutamate receptor C-terminal domain-containing protein n=1 Tax=Pyrocoelia pectoralis TaxID=417401 RepID=A0AAN7V1X1_9COLE
MVPVIILSLFSFIICQGANGSLEISEPSDELQQCVSHTVEKLFCEASSVYVVQDDHDYDISTLSSNIPHVYIDVYQPMGGHTWGYGYNFLILAQNVSSLSSLLENLEKSKVWNSHESALGRFLIVLLSQDIEMVFKLLWKFNIVNALVVIKGNEGYNVYSSDPFHPKNNCGNNVQELVKQTCSSLVVEFPKPLRNLNGCPIAFAKNEVQEFLYKVLNISFSYLKHASNVRILHENLNVSDMEMLRRNNTATMVMVLNATLQYSKLNVSSEIFRDYFVILHEKLNVSDMEILRRNNTATMITVLNATLQYNKLNVSSEIFRDYFVYASPVDHNLFTLDVIAAIFEYEVWIAVLLIFLITLLIWWIILKFKKSAHGGMFCDVLINIFSLSTCGCIRRVPHIGMLRNIILMYLFYVIVIQTAFKSKLITALTSPIDNNKIKSLEDVANSKLPVCDANVLKNVFFQESKPRDTIYTNIQKKLTPILEDKTSQFIEKKCIYLITNIGNILFLSNYGKASTVTEDRYAGNGKLFLGLSKPHYVMSSINAAIERWKESGIYNADMKKNLPKSPTTEDEDDEPVVITLQHLSGVFAIWGICISFAFIVFIMELVVHKYLSK